MFDLTGRSALVTGAGQGLGAGIARHLAEQGAHVIVNDLVASKAASTVATIQELGGNAEPLAFDVTQLEAVEQALAARPLDIVINNAGNAGATVMQPTPFRDMDPKQWAAPIDVNLHGVMNVTRTVLPGMCERQFGRLITISSGAGVIGLPIGVAPYGAAKGGAISFMRHMAIENASFGVTANSLALGLMEMTDIHNPDLVTKLAKQVPCGRLGTGDDVGPACIWLASNEASWVTGQTIHVSGGSVTT
ncbi:MAG: SDR family NAD(P)-dependent oxidoreductase [Candidatus Binatia bacterium]|nr:SDR family NAD(P)-dependent oxidoreductase [Candidatus Binatia bacterium]